MSSLTKAVSQARVLVLALTCLLVHYGAVLEAADDNGQQTMSEEEKISEQEPLFESFGVRETLTSVLVAAGAMLAAGGGLGGGGMFVPLFVLVLGFDPKEAVTLSQSTIFGGSIVNYVVNWRARHPDDEERPLINYDAVIMLEPMLLIGTIIGVFANKAFPSWALVILLVITVGYGTVRTYKKAMQVYRKEQEARKGTSSTTSNDSGSRGTELREVSVDVGLGDVDDATPTHDKSELQLNKQHGLALSPSDTLLVEKMTESPARRRVLQSSQIRIEHTRQLKLSMQGKENQDDVSSASENHDMVPLIHKRIEHTRKVKQQQTSKAGEGALASFPDDPFDRHGHAEERSRLASSSSKTREAEAADGSSLGENATEKHSQESSGQGTDLPALQKIKKREKNQVRYGLIMLSIIAVVSVLSLFRGGKAGSESILGFDACSTAYWMITLATFFVCVILTLVYAAWLIGQERLKEEVGYKFLRGDIHWTRRTAIIYPLYAIFAGVFGGMLGIGGGMILGPLLLELGLIAETTAATSAMAVFLTSASATIQFWLVGLLKLDYALWFGGIGLVSTAVGVKVIRRAIRRSKSASIIIFSVAATMGVSTVLMAVAGIIQVIKDVGDKEYGFSAVC